MPRWFLKDIGLTAAVAFGAVLAIMLAGVLLHAVGIGLGLLLLKSLLL